MYQTNPKLARDVIIARAPVRISFAGGGSDLPAFYLHEPGAVVTASINKYIYITVNKKFDDQIRVSYSVTEMVDHVEELHHELVREALRTVGIDSGIEITSISDIPSEGTGLGSSSSYVVAMLHALHAYAGRHASAARLAEEACAIELDRCRKPIGKQDQYIAAYGGLQFMQFTSDNVLVEPVPIGTSFLAEFERHLMLFYTGLTRSGDPILAEQQRNLVEDAAVRTNTAELRDLAYALRRALLAKRLTDVGEILDAGWAIKRRLASGITSPEIDGWYGRARDAGAIGGKLLGAGGGGFLLLFARPEDHAAVKTALPELRWVPFRLEPHGSRIIYVQE